MAFYKRHFALLVAVARVLSEVENTQNNMNSIKSDQLQTLCTGVLEGELEFVSCFSDYKLDILFKRFMLNYTTNFVS